MRSARRSVLLFSLGASAVLTAAAILGLGTDRWVSSGYRHQTADAETEIWSGGPRSGGLKPVVATEAEWLAMQSTTSTRLHAATAASSVQSPGATRMELGRIDLGPLDVVDVRPLPAGVDLGGDGKAEGAKMLVSAREPATGRIVRLIVDAADVGAASRIGKHDGL
jgi:hypothetical protein